MSPHQDLTVLPAQLDELDIVRGILSDAAQVPIGKGVTDQWPAEFQAEPILAAIANGTLHLVFTPSGIAVATLVLQWEDELWWGVQPPVAGYVHRLAISSQARGQGLGEYLLDWAQQQVRVAGRSMLRLDVTSHNPRLCRYYEGLGFQWVRDVTLADAAGQSVTDSLYERSCG